MNILAEVSPSTPERIPNINGGIVNEPVDVIIAPVRIAIPFANSSIGPMNEAAAWI